MLPDMSDTLREWEINVKLKTVTEVTTNFVKTRVVTVVDLLAVVQPADKTKLQIDSLDWSKEYITCHKRGGGIEMGQFVEWDGRDFKIVGPNGNYKIYGYIEMVGEETKQPLLVATP